MADLTVPAIGEDDDVWGGILNTALTTLNNAKVEKDELVYNVKDYGALGNGSANDTAAFNEAISAAGDGTIYVPAGDYRVASVALAGPIDLRGAGQQATFLRNLTGTVLSVSGTQVNVQDLTVRSGGGGHAIVQSGNIDQGQWTRVRLVQNGNSHSVWDNAAYHLVDMRFNNGYSEHTQTATVPSWNLVAIGGVINSNVWEKWRAQMSGNYHWWVEATGANAHYSATWRDVTFEVCTGGGIKLLAVRHYAIDNCINYDMTAGTGGITTLQRHFIHAEKNASSINCSGEIRRVQRLAGANEAGILDVVLPTSGAGGGTSIETCRNVGTGDPFTINLNSNWVFVTNNDPVRATLTNADAAVTISPGAGTVTLLGTVWQAGTGSPEGVVTAGPGSFYFNKSGGAGATFWVKESGTGNTGWVAGGGSNPWAAWTPAFSGTGWASGNATATAKYTTIGKTVHWFASFVMGSTTTFGTGGLLVSLPVAKAAAAGQSGCDADATDQGAFAYQLRARYSGTTTCQVYTVASTSILGNVTSTAPFTWATSDVLNVWGTYEAA